MNKEHTKTIRLDSSGWGLSLDLKGGRIVSLYHGDKKILGTYNRIDGKAGNTHVCLPNFADEGRTLGLPFHGPPRTLSWTVKARRRYSLVIACDIPSTELYPSTLHIEQLFMLQNSFVHEIKATNCGNFPVPLNIGCHYYWNTPSDWRGTRINGKDISDKIQTNGLQELLPQNIIQFPGFSYTVTQTGFSDIVLWTGFKKEDNEKIFDTSYCCIEPVRGKGSFFGSPSSLLHPKESVSTSFRIDETV